MTTAVAVGTSMTPAPKRACGGYRPALPVSLQEKIAQLRADRVSYRRIARQLGVSVSSCVKYGRPRGNENGNGHG